MLPLRAEAATLNVSWSEVNPSLEQAQIANPGLEELTVKRARVRIAQRAARNDKDQATLQRLDPGICPARWELDRLTAAQPQVKATVLEREKLLKPLGDNREKQQPFSTALTARGDKVQLSQEFGGLIGRILLAFLLVTALARRTLLRLFVVPGIFVSALTYFMLYHSSTLAFSVGIFLCGLLIVGQFSYFGEYLPKIFPVHLRGTGGSFATNVGGRMVGTSAAFLSTNIIAPMLAPKPGFDHYAMAAGITGTMAFLLAFALTYFLPEPTEEKPQG